MRSNDALKFRDKYDFFKEKRIEIISDLVLLRCKDRLNGWSLTTALCAMK